ncbi:DUF1761 domain-containing protein [Virgisporangium ochraceum]
MVALGIGIATIAAFIVSSVYYGVMPAAGGPAGAAPGSGRPEPWQIAAELVRLAITAGIVAGLLVALDRGGVGAGALIGLVLWVLPFVLLSGSVVWERVPVARAALHTGDWLVKLVVIGAVVGATV